MYNIYKAVESDSAPVRGDGYEPRSSKFQIQSQCRDVIQRVGRPSSGCKRWGGSKKFLHRMVRS